MRDWKRYIGDGVYADFDGYHIVLTTSNGLSVTNTIYLEPECLRSLMDMNREIIEAWREQAEEIGPFPEGVSRT